MARKRRSRLRRSTWSSVRPSFKRREVNFLAFFEGRVLGTPWFSSIFHRFFNDFQRFSSISRRFSALEVRQQLELLRAGDAAAEDAARIRSLRRRKAFRLRRASKSIAELLFIYFYYLFYSFLMVSNGFQAFLRLSKHGSVPGTSWMRRSGSWS